MGAKPYPLGAAGEEVQSGQRVKVGLVGPEGGDAVGGVGIEGADFAGQDDVVADPDVVEAQIVGPLGQGAQLVRARPAGPRVGTEVPKVTGMMSSGSADSRFTCSRVVVQV